MVRRREPTLRILLEHLTAVFSKPADGAHVLAFHRDSIAGLKPVANPNTLARLRPRRDRRRRPGPAFNPGSRGNGAFGVGTHSAWATRLAGIRNDCGSGLPRVTSPTKRIDFGNKALEINDLLELADVDDLLKRNEQIGLTALGDPHIGFGRKEDSLSGVRWPLEDLEDRTNLGISSLDGVAKVDDPLNYGHVCTLGRMEWRVL
jgi:hypothetical protein